jgi:hypothetical protein
MLQLLLRCGLVFVLAGAAPAARADTLYLQNGQRLEGLLVGVRGSSIEFEYRDGGRPRLARLERYEVRRIEIDDRGNSGGSGGNWGGSGGDWGGSGSGMRERTVNVNANEEWTDTGIELRRGQELRFRASGKVRWGPGRNDGPSGEGGNHYNANRPLPDRPAASLIGRLGGPNDIFFIGGDDGPVRVRDSGRLYLGINDDYLLDNSGTFRVTIYY